MYGENKKNQIKRLQQATKINLENWYLDSCHFLTDRFYYTFQTKTRKMCNVNFGREIKLMIKKNGKKLKEIVAESHKN